ncbi:DoxX family protein [Aquimarina litoralis]|uniref:DoxX family protein n=1 Tax=Aquimarina litoralis TaxID=584605 RepID=UPI002484D121|nr:DoxX family protein [Aquimarina litoralis]MBW1297399.1 hypothetical protein [Aquimarina litoralis]
MHKKIVKWLTWLLTIICSIIFLLASLGKFRLEGNMYDNFIRWNYNGLTLICVGIIELIGAILLLIPRFRKYGIVLLISIMLGAVFTHFRNFEELGFPLLPMGLIIILIVVHFLNQKLLTNA